MRLDHVLRARAILISVKQRLPAEVPDPLAPSFHEDFAKALAHLVAAGIDVEEFSLPQPSKRQRAGPKQAAPDQFQARLDACLIYVELLTPIITDSPKRIGFVNS